MQSSVSVVKKVKVYICGSTTVKEDANARGSIEVYPILHDL